MAIFKMRSNRKNQEKKKQWLWAEDTHPDNINDSHISKAFFLELRKCKPLSNHRACSSNPFCLSTLGEQHWLQNKVSLLEDLELKYRETKAFCGLKNLGATCYINSLLQLWFHNINIRNAILNWNPMEDETEILHNPTLSIENGYEPVTCVGQLQLIFALMQFGKQKTINPEAFILSLKIDTSIEQDAEEFSNLLLTTLEKKFEKQTNSSVREMVKNNFRGEYQSVITCLTCKTESKSCSTFRDLSLNIEGQQTLNNSLKDYLKEEVLAGDDQYYCNKCKGKQNAVRQMCLTALPSVLNFQLMRFVYDRESMQKTKLNTMIKFPQTLDMAQYLNLPKKQNATSRKNYKYNLYAVLIHKGSSANCGHYVAQIKENTTQQWYQFNDDQVDKLTIKGLNLCTNDELKKFKSMKNIKNPNKEFQSTDAYMLVYIKDLQAKKTKTKSIVCKLSPRLTQLVNTCNHNFENKILDCNRSKIFVEQMLNLINEIKNGYKNENFDIISLEWLKYLLKVNPNEIVKKIDNNTILCKHNLLDPDKVHQAKYIGSDLADKLYDMFQGGPRLKLMSSLCKVCVRNKCALLYTKTLTIKQNESITTILRNWSQTNHTNSEDSETSYWVSNETIKCWQRKYFESFQTFLNTNDVLPNTTLPINYETLSEPGSSLCKKIIVNEDIKQKNGNMTINAENIIKLECNNNTYGESNTEVESKDNVFPYEESFNEIYNNYCYCYFQNIEHMQWKFNNDIMCRHGNMSIGEHSKILVPKKVIDLFQIYFPKASLFDKTTVPCYMCRSVHIRLLLCKYTHLSLAKLENYFLNDLLWNNNRNVFSKEPSPYACISAEFLETFRTFVRSPLEVPIPKCIMNEVLLCNDHKKLIYHPTMSLIPTQYEYNKLVLITKKEWKWLIHCYAADYGIFVYFDAQRKFTISKPEICETCRQKKLLEDKMNKLEYSNIEIFIEVDNIDDQNGNCLKKFKRDTTVSANSAYGSNIASTSMNNNNKISRNEFRRSKRKRKPKVESVMISLNDTVFDLKLKIMKVFNVLPINQCLKTIEGVELQNNKATMRDFNILPQSVILAQFNEEKIHKSEVATEQETGFKGTELMH
ncbi:ubiquitin carboxyl-terminal hydrolase 48-like [Rhopalosiphum maidis]|uniref:ubiquitin carboxyl-terminal hydrolase 48-like n=1 Tax=Rhopalosiphum maidis TaxID=43146 RepID=UPI000EFE2559|nr:ubiquitin carboxyl-terminal hydrolase 48-like [Rhopalosiphum maidis]